ncbi:hypothetical protein [Moheibacter sp.]|uniref:hypothetical protein n=1 Tax=Moheibacter sp. TaxID=1965316 RepID=UPI003C761E1E
MKQPFTYLLIFLCVGFIFAQEQPVYIGNQVEQMAVFPGCEKIDNSDTNALTNCMSEQLSGRLISELDGLDEALRQSGVFDAQAQIQFVISREGIIIGIEPMEGSNSILGDAASVAMEKIAMELPPIRPAMLKKGQPVNLVFQLPVRFQIEEKAERLAGEFPVDEIMLFTLLTDKKDLRYEVRWFKNKDIKIYEIRNNQATFLGKFLTLNEVEGSEPYKSLIEKSRNADKILVADGFLDKEFFEIYIYNLFDPAQRKPVFVEVVQIEDEKPQSVFKFQTEAEFNDSRFVSLIYRD